MGTSIDRTETPASGEGNQHRLKEQEVERGLGESGIQGVRELAAAPGSGNTRTSAHFLKSYSDGGAQTVTSEEGAWEQLSQK